MAGLPAGKPPRGRGRDQILHVWGQILLTNLIVGSEGENTDESCAEKLCREDTAAK